MIKMALALSASGCARPFIGRVWAQVVPGGGASSDVFPGETRQDVSLIADLIIPPTDTPGAVAAGVPEFIELMVADWYTDAERRAFFEGLEKLNAYCAETFGHSFSRCAPEEQTAALEDAERQALEYAAEHSAKHSDPVFSEETDEHAPFFAKIKELTVLGYYTSEIGATEELKYNPVPGRYDGAYRFAKVRTQWSY
jgi:hypothetical protein